jgi:hypothetical protein
LKQRGLTPISLPSNEDLAPQLQRLEAESGSVVLIAVPSLETQTFPRATSGFVDAAKRKAPHVALNPLP